MSEIERLLGQCGLPQFYKKLLAANITTRSKLQEKRALLPSLIPHPAQLQHLLDTLDNVQPPSPSKPTTSSPSKSKRRASSSSTSGVNHPINTSVNTARPVDPYATAADMDEADVDDSLPVPEECDDPVWGELSRWEHVLRRRLRYLSEARSDAMLARSNIYHFSTAPGAGRAGGGRAPTAAAVNASSISRSSRIQDTRRQQLQFDHIKTLLAMARNAMKQHRRNAELLATERKHTYRGAASSREEDAVKAETDRGVEMVRRILIVLQEDGPTLMDVDVVHRGAEGTSSPTKGKKPPQPTSPTSNKSNGDDNNEEDEEFLVNGRKATYVNVDTFESTEGDGSADAAASSNSKGQPRTRVPSKDTAKQALAKEAEAAMVDIGDDPRRPILISQGHLDVLGPNSLLDRYTELYPSDASQPPPVGDDGDHDATKAGNGDEDALGSMVERLESALATPPSVSDEALTPTMIQSYRDQQLLLRQMFTVCTRQQACTRELLLRVKSQEEELWEANDTHQKESLRYAEEVHTLNQRLEEKHQPEDEVEEDRE